MNRDDSPTWSNDQPDRLPLINGKLLLTIDEAARYVSMGRSHFYTYVLRGEIRSVKLGRSRRIPVAALYEFMDHLLDQVPQ